MAQLGTATLYLLLILATWTASLAVVGARRRSDALVQSARYALYAVAATATLAIVLLAHAFVISDFSLTYVQQHSERSMPLFYRITALWGGMEGSLLLWAWLLSIVSAVAIHRNFDRLRELIPYAIAVLMTVLIFFCVLMVAHSDPFSTYLVGAPALGKGLNPLLQNPYMVTHPPSLYTGFVTLSVPFAFGMAALLSGQLDSAWLRAARPWALLGWFFLSLGLTLGMLWAYEELGWGGYWGWDPVENAGFMPWLLVTAFLHSIMVEERRRMLRSWNLILALLAFVMTIFGTFLTRSGFIDSVHAFARSNIGYVFLAFIGLSLAVGFSLVIWRRPALRTRGEVESVFSREFWFLLNNWVLLSACLLVMVLTTFPNLSEVFGDKITISIAAFNRWMVPLGLVLLVLTVVGPMLGWRKTTARGARRQFTLPSIITVVTVIALVATGLDDSPKAAIAWALSAAVIATVVQELVRGATSRSRAAGIGWLSALIGLIGRNRRRYGGYVVHIGITLMCIGFAGEAFKLEREVMMRPGQRIDIGQYTLRYDGIRQSRDAQKTMVTAALTVYRQGHPTAVMQPARWIFFKHEDNPTTEVAIRRSIREDLFVALGDFDPKQGTTTFKLVVNPLVNWIWLGFFVLALGAAIAGLPGLPRRASGRADPSPGGGDDDPGSDQGGPTGGSGGGGRAGLAAVLLAASIGAPAVARAEKAPQPAASHEKLDHDGPVVLSAHSGREKHLFSRLTCQCGGCPRLPLDKCPCGFADRERRAIRDKIARGWTNERVIAWYTEKRGPEIGKKPFGAKALAIPPDTPFNRLYWMVPYAASAAAVLALLWVGRRWRRRHASAATGASPRAPLETPTSSASDPYEELLERELDRLD